MAKRARPKPPQPSRPSREQALTKAEAADRLGLTERRLEQLVLQYPDLPCQGSGARRRFLWPALREWRDKQLVQQGVRSVRPLSVEDARARKLTAEATLMEIELDARRAELMPTPLYAQGLEAAMARLRGILLNAPTRYAPQLLERFRDRFKAGDLRRIEDFLREMISLMMAELEAGDDIPEDEDPPTAQAGRPAA